jgi:hypothetical protein
MWNYVNNLYSVEQFKNRIFGTSLLRNVGYIIPYRGNVDFLGFCPWSSPCLCCSGAQVITPLRIPQKVHIYPILMTSYNRDIVDFLGSLAEHEKSIKSTHIPCIIVYRGFVDFLGNSCSWIDLVQSTLLLMESAYTAPIHKWRRGCSLRPPLQRSWEENVLPESSLFAYLIPDSLIIHNRHDL